jgi:hypothetical protein
MFKLLLFSGFLSIWAHTCTQTGDHSTTVQALDQTPVTKVDTTSTAAIDFDADIKPIFQSHCQPCHFTGGKMYERMPFDQAKTIRDHSEGIFRRIKNPEEVKKLTAFLKQRI